MTILKIEVETIINKSSVSKISYLGQSIFLLLNNIHYIEKNSVIKFFSD